MTDFWKRKLLAYLHDPPHKPFRIAGHEDARGPLLRHLNLSEQEIDVWQHQPDWWAAAADRFPFPRADVCFVDWKADGGLEFRHPLCGSRLIPPNQPRPRASVPEKWLEDVVHGLPVGDAGWKEKFFRLWRLWPERAAREKNPLLAYLVADTRLPDHTLWHHNGIVSALEAVGSPPAFLQFQIGPVQDFIQQARKLQDLWSGSYLLSFLISKALATVALELGPDVVIHPNLRGVPLLEWWWLEEARENGLFPEALFRLGEGRLHPNELLTPALPNRFLALVPSGEEGQRIARKAEAEVRDLWRMIADKVHAEICTRLADHLKRGEFARWDHYWQEQVERFPMTDWIIHPWVAEKSAFDGAATTDDPLPPLTNGWENHPLRHADLWRDMIPPNDREKWHGNRNDAFAWALHSAATDWQVAAAKNTRSFPRWPQLEEGHQSPPKDHLNGRDEVLGGENPEAFWHAMREVFGGAETGDFKGKQFYGAINVIKRLWPRVYLKDHLGWTDWKPEFDSVPELAQIDRAMDANSEDAEIYYAVLFMDGDDMGQWVNGVKTPPLGKVLADKAWEYVQKHWKPIKTQLAGKQVEWHAITDIMPANNGQLEQHPVQRPLSPGYHAALSEALSNFSLYCAGQIVKAFSGQLIYAGGDDVVAMLPAANALDCAHALQLAFRGELPPGTPARVREKLEALFQFYPESPGFIRCLSSGKDESQRPNWPLMVPGPRATASVGIAIGHVRAPMQDTIQAAREAEAAAKGVPCKGAFCLRILKRSGESAEFAARWQSGVAGVWDELLSGVHDQSGRFAYRYLDLVVALLTLSGKDADEGWVPAWTPELVEAAEAELCHVLRQQAKQEKLKAAENARIWMEKLVGVVANPALTPRGFIHFWMAWAFLRRLQPDSKS